MLGGLLTPKPVLPLLPPPVPVVEPVASVVKDVVNGVGGLLGGFLGAGRDQQDDGYRFDLSDEAVRAAAGDAAQADGDGDPVAARPEMAMPAVPPSVGVADSGLPLAPPVATGTADPDGRARGVGAALPAGDGLAAQSRAPAAAEPDLDETARARARAIRLQERESIQNLIARIGQSSQDAAKAYAVAEAQTAPANPQNAPAIQRTVALV